MNPPVGFGLAARAGLDRADALRSEPQLLATHLADPRSRVLLLADGEVPLRDDGMLALVGPAHLDAALDDPVLLGTDARGVAHFAAPVAALPREDGVRAVGVREAVVSVSGPDVEMLLHATGVLNWHAQHRHCARCGAPTDAVHGGHRRVCPVDGSQHFPRTDPAVIMAVVDEDDRLLLARHVGRYDRYTTLAGFVEPGESLEAAVVREVREECDVSVGAVTYVGSQPWPFPSSLMVGFVARAGSTAITVDGAEVAEASWFTRPELEATIAAGRAQLTSLSIASLLIRRWLDGELPTPELPPGT